MNNPPMDAEFYANGCTKMIDEGLEFAGKIIHYMKQHGERLSKLERTQRKKTILEEREEFSTFAQIHPIVYEYIVTEQVFNRNAFKRYIRAAFGKPKSDEEQELIAKDKRNVYYIKNRQYALYYKYLLRESNPHTNSSDINQMYNAMLDELNTNTKHMLDQYEEAQKKVEIQNEQLTEAKRQELVAVLKQRLTDINN
jgi:Zn-dependent M32 family carboxypeptidase